MAESLRKGGACLKYTEKEVLQFIEENDVKFVRLMFFDIFGTTKNISIMADELPVALKRALPLMLLLLEASKTLMQTLYLCQTLQHSLSCRGDHSTVGL